MRICLRAGCGERFSPQHKSHIFCSEGCWTAVLHEEIGDIAAGMRPLGFMGSREKIQGVRRKYERMAKRPAA